jgi:hypothetical protein
MNETITLLLIGVALGSIPTRELGRIMVAFLAKRVGVKAKEIERYEKATDDSSGD